MCCTVVNMYCSTLSVPGGTACVALTSLLLWSKLSSAPRRYLHPNFTDNKLVSMLHEKNFNALIPWITLCATFCLRPSRGLLTVLRNSCVPRIRGCKRGIVLNVYELVAYGTCKTKLKM
jgi:hypothetical protein